MTRRGVAVEAALVIAGFALMAIAVTWPVVLHMTTRIPGGGYGGDPVGYLWDIYYAAAHGLNLVGTATQDTVTADFGRPVVASTNMNQILTLGPAWVVAELWSPVAGMNVGALLGLTLSSASMYLLIRWMRLGYAVAIWAGVAYMLFPYHLAKTAAHLPLTQLAAFPLVLLTGLRWIERPTWRRAALLAGALGVGWLSHPYYGVMASAMVAALVAYGLVRQLRVEGAAPAAASVGRVAATAFGLVGIPLAVLFVTSRSGVDSAYERSVVELDVYGARIGDYLVPDPGNSLMRALIGDARWAEHASAGGERVAYLGWVTLALVAVAAILGVRRRRSLPPRWRLALLSAVPTAAALVLLSLASPVRLLGVEFPGLSRIVFEVLPYIRAFARFSAPVMAVALLVGAIGLRLLVRGRSRPLRAVVIGSAIVLSAIELPPGFPVPSDVPVRIDGVPADRLPAWQWLRDADPGSVVLEAPAFAGTQGEAMDRIYMYGQLVHGHPTANGGLNETSIGADFGDMLGDPRLPRAATRYAAAGVEYVVVSGWSFRRRGLETPALAAPPPGFAVERVFADSAVWRVTAAPADGLAVFRRSEWWVPELVDGTVWRWMRDTGRMRVVTPEAGRYRFAFSVRGFREAPYRVRIDIPGSRPVEVTVTREPRTLLIAVDLPAGTTDVRLTRIGGPPARQISAVDLRVVSVQVSDPIVRRVDAAGG